MKKLVLGVLFIMSQATLPASTYVGYIQCSTSSNGYNFLDESRVSDVAIQSVKGK